MGLDESDPSCSDSEISLREVEPTETLCRNSEEAKCFQLKEGKLLERPTQICKRVASFCSNEEIDCSFGSSDRSGSSCIGHKTSVKKDQGDISGLFEGPSCSSSKIECGESKKSSVRRPSRKKLKETGICLKREAERQDKLLKTCNTESCFTQTDCYDITLNKLCAEELNDCSASNLERLGRRYSKLRFLLMLYHERLVEVENENGTLKDLCRNLQNRFSSEKKRIETELSKFQVDFRSIIMEMNAYHKALLGAYDEFDVKRRSEKERVSEVIDGYSETSKKMQDIIKVRSAEVEHLRASLDQLKRELAVQNRESYLARQRAADAEKKLSDQLYMACKTKCPSCKVYEKNKDVLYGQIAEKTVIIDRAVAKLDELKEKVELGENTIDQLREENARLTFEKKSWEHEAMRLEEELKSVKTQNGNVSTLLTPYTSNNSTTSDDTVEQNLIKLHVATQTTNSSETSIAIHSVEKSKAQPCHLSPIGEISNLKTRGAECLSLQPLTTDTSLSGTPNAFSAWLRPHLEGKVTPKATEVENHMVADFENKPTTSLTLTQSCDGLGNKNVIRSYAKDSNFKFKRIKRNEFNFRKRRKRSEMRSDNLRGFVAECTERNQNIGSKNIWMFNNDEPKLSISERIKEAFSSVEEKRKKETLLLTASIGEQSKCNSNSGEISFNPEIIPTEESLTTHNADWRIPNGQAEVDSSTYSQVNKVGVQLECVRASGQKSASVRNVTSLASTHSLGQDDISSTHLTKNVLISGKPFKKKDSRHFRRGRTVFPISKKEEKGTSWRKPAVRKRKSRKASRTHSLQNLTGRFLHERSKVAPRSLLEGVARDSEFIGNPLKNHLKALREDEFRNRGPFRGYEWRDNLSAEYLRINDEQSCRMLSSNYDLTEGFWSRTQSPVQYYLENGLPDVPVHFDDDSWRQNNRDARSCSQDECWSRIDLRPASGTVIAERCPYFSMGLFRTLVFEAFRGGEECQTRFLETRSRFGSVGCVDRCYEGCTYVPLLHIQGFPVLTGCGIWEYAKMKPSWLL